MKHMRLGKLFALITAVALLAACGGGGMFVPDLGPFVGVLLVEEEPVGAISLTAGPGQVGGTGNITHNGSAVSVSIAAVLNDHGQPHAVTPAHLGDRVILDQVRVVDGGIDVVFKTYRQDEALDWGLLTQRELTRLERRALRLARSRDGECEEARQYFEEDDLDDAFEKPGP